MAENVWVFRQEETDLIYEGIETHAELAFLDNHLSEETDLIYEGIETQCPPFVFNVSLHEETDLIYEGIETGIPSTDIHSVSARRNRPNLRRD